MPTDFLEQNLTDALGDRYLSYALSTIMSRSLPDVRDGLKPVHRRLLYAMRELKLNPTTSFKKCARVVGDVIGKYHPHGDVAVYDAMVRLAQDFSLRYPLVEGQGNFGNIDGDNAAAMRYTESRLTDISMLMFEGIEEDAVQFKNTYDNEGAEPEVLPAAFPNLLANGTSGIAVGMACNIPPHNILELCDALQLIIENKDCTIKDITKVLKGPDFPTGGTLHIDLDTLYQTYETGRGSFTLRAKYEVASLQRGKYQIVVTEIPYGVTKGKLLEKIGALMEAKKLNMINDVLDESTTDIRLIIEPKSSNISPELLMEHLFKQTDLEVRFGLNMNVLSKNHVPSVMSIKEVLQHYLYHRHEVLINRTKHRLDKITSRLNLLHGYLIAHLNIDEVIHIIREHDDPKPKLQARFNLNETQAEAILNMRLRALRKLEEIQIKNELTELEKEQTQKETLLQSEAKQWSTIKKEVQDLRTTFEKLPTGQRKTSIQGAINSVEITAEDFIEKESITVILSQNGWIKSIKGHSVKTDDIKYKDGDEALLNFECQTTDKLILFTTVGKFYTIGADKISGGRGHGDPLRMMVDMEPIEHIVTMFPYGENVQYILASSDGRGFKIDSDQLLSSTKKGKQILNVAPNEKALTCLLAKGDSVAVVGENRKLLIFPLDQLPTMNRGRGVMLQKYIQGGLSDIKPLTLEDGLKWASGDRTRHEKDLQRWVGKRNQAGRLAPTGFPRNNRFS